MTRSGPATAPAGGVGHFAGDRWIEFHAWQALPAGRGRQSFLSGRSEGVLPTLRGLEFGRATGRRSFADPFVDAADGSVAAGPGTPVDYRTASWTSATHMLGFGAQDVIVSWNAETPGRSWIEVQIQPLMRTVDDTGVLSGTTSSGQWFTMGRWCRLMPAQGGAIHRAGVDGQSDDDATVWTDTLSAAAGRAVVGYRLRVTMLRPERSIDRPVVTLLGAMASRLPDADTVPVSPVGRGAGRELRVRPLSQMVHKGQYPQWGGGGASWCSPTSVAMAMGYYSLGPTSDELAHTQLHEGPAAPFGPMSSSIVPFSARATWDHQYRGAGNWAFSAAYPAEYGLECFVTRLPSLTAMEEFIVAGIPVVASVAFEARELDGAGYSTKGHLLLIIGFTEDGDVIVNDPASHMIASDDQVRVVYRREQFENVWLPRSGGTVYVIHPRCLRLPAGSMTGI
ncbi:MAG: C39 family peptidase [Acidipropionibacterium sp.]|jgi:hypothetical protein|nr:C39 family peptidase [Acidipropionibacterium sp.]